MAIAYSLDPEVYIPKGDMAGPKGDRSEFFFRIPTWKVLNEHLDKPEDFNPMGEDGLQVLRDFLRGWKNLKDRHGNEVEFKADENGVPTDPTLFCLPPVLRIELVGFALSLLILGKDDEKNLPSAPGSERSGSSAPAAHAPDKKT